MYQYTEAQNTMTNRVKEDFCKGFVTNNCATTSRAIQSHAQGPFNHLHPLLENLFSRRIKSTHTGRPLAVMSE